MRNVNVTNMLHRGNLTPREKFLLLIKNEVQKIKTGKDILTDADKDALENWQPHTNEEAREWNRLNEGWKRTGKMEIEAEFIFKDAQVAYLSLRPILMEFLRYPLMRELGLRIEGLKHLKTTTLDEAVEIAKRQRAVKLEEGIDFEYAVYRLAIETLAPEDRKRLNELYPDVETDHQYLDQEEVIANLYGGKEKLSQEAKEKLATLVAEHSYNNFAKEYQLFHYYACIPILEVARFFLDRKGVPVESSADDEEDSLVACDNVTKAMTKYAEDHGITMREALKEGCLMWLEGGFEDAHTPLVISSDADLFTRWLATKKKARAKLKDYIKKGVLSLRERSGTESIKEKLYSKNLHHGELEVARMALEDLDVPKGELDEKIAFETFSDAVITGESLYAFPQEYEFIEDFKERVDTYDPNLGLVYADDDPDHKEHLDREFVVCKTNPEDKEPIIFGIFGMSMLALTTIFENQQTLEERNEGGRKMLAFKNGKLKEAFAERCKELIEAYAKLLAFEAIYKRLEEEYEVDLSSYTENRILSVRGYMEEINQGIETATGAADKLKKKGGLLSRYKEVLEPEEGLLIDIDAITPDLSAVADHEEELKKVFGKF